MLIYLGFDDTDDHQSAMGTGRLVREFCARLPEGCVLEGIVRHQLPRFENIPYTSNNSSACALVHLHPDVPLDTLRDLAVTFLEAHCAPGSDPGLCVAPADSVTPQMVEFGQSATSRTLSQQQAMDTARDVQLFGLGGTNDGIIGATAAVGLTRYGWCGRFIEFGGLRSLASTLTVRDLMNEGIRVVSVDRDPLVPQPDDAIHDGSWLRPSLMGGQPVLQVRAVDHGIWEPAHSKRGKHGNRKPGMHPGKHRKTATLRGIS